MRTSFGYPAPTCDQEGCQGHLGKFQSCRDEALYEMSLSGFEESTGDVEFEGHLTKIHVDEDETVCLEGDLNVVVPAGSYLVESTNSGAVYVTEGSYLEITQAFDAADASYSAWLSDDDESEV